MRYVPSRSIELGMQRVRLFLRRKYSRVCSRTHRNRIMKIPRLSLIVQFPVFAVLYLCLGIVLFDRGPLVKAAVEAVGVSALCAWLRGV